MLKDVVSVEPLEGYRLKLRFEDGVTGIIDVEELIPLTGVSAALQDRSQFLAVRLDPELGTICWPCGADLDPDVLYAIVTGTAITTHAAH